MEKTMVCTWVSPIQSSTITRRDGTNTTIDYFNCMFTDGIDQIMAESSSNATAIIKEHPLQIGVAYSIRVKLQVIKFKDKDQNERSFFKALLMDIGAYYSV